MTTPTQHHLLHSSTPHPYNPTASNCRAGLSSCSSRFQSARVVQLELIKIQNRSVQIELMLQWSQSWQFWCGTGVKQLLYTTLQIIKCEKWGTCIPWVTARVSGGRDHGQWGQHRSCQTSTMLWPWLYLDEKLDRPGPINRLVMRSSKKAYDE